MKKFHKYLNIMSIFTALILVCALIFWRTFLNIAVTNIFLNGIIIGTMIFGICLCFVCVMRLVPEYKWMRSYFDGHANYGFAPRILRPIALALRNRHARIDTSDLSKLLEMVSIRIEEDRDSVRYITNTLVFLGLLGTFWGLIVTVGGFAELLINLDFTDELVLENMQLGMAGPLAGMATAFTSSLLGLGGSLIVGFLGLMLQFAQNTLFQELTDSMSIYVLQTPGHDKAIELHAKAPVDEKTYTKISKMYDMFTGAKYYISDLIRIDGKYPAIVAIGSNEKLYIATLVDDVDVLENTLKRFDLCFADTLEGVNIDMHMLCIARYGFNNTDGRIIRFSDMNAMQKYLNAHPNVRPTTNQDKENFDAYAEYINTALEYLFKK